MVYAVFAWAGQLVVNSISVFGYPGVFVLMLLESASIPIPSEIIMPFSGYLIWVEKFSLLPVVLWGTLGNLVGSIIAYLVGLYGGRPLAEKYGKYVLLSSHDLDRAENWFKKYGSISVLFSRMLPVVRTFISLPAGVAKMPFLKFCLYTFLGSLPWAFVLTYAGIIMGENWSGLEGYFRQFDWAILALILLTVSWYLYAKLSRTRSPSR